MFLLYNNLFHIQMPYSILPDQRNVCRSMYVLRENDNLIITHFIHVRKSMLKPLITIYPIRH